MNDASNHGRSGPFWVVWRPGGGGPTMRHPSEESAVKEAERLARKFPGEDLFVLASVCSRRVCDMVRIDLRPDDGIPF